MLWKRYGARPGSRGWLGALRHAASLISGVRVTVATKSRCMNPMLWAAEDSEDRGTLRLAVVERIWCVVSHITSNMGISHRDSR